jgi:hypothetical protein
MRARLIILTMLLMLIAGSVLAQESDIQIFATEDDAFTFEYPMGWMVEIINPEYGPNAHLSVDNLPLEERFESPEGINLQISLPTKYYSYGFSNAETPAEMVALAGGGVTQASSFDFATPAADKTPLPLQITPATPDVTEFQVDGRPAAYAYNGMKMAGIDASYLLIVADLGNDYWVSVRASAFVGGLEMLQHNEAQILAIVESMRYNPPASANSGNPDLPNVFTGLDGIWKSGTISFAYPENWYVTSTIIVMISNKKGNVLNVMPESGQFIAAVQGVAETIVSADPSTMGECRVGDSGWTAEALVKEIIGQTTPARWEQMEKAGITVTQPEVITINNVDIVYLRYYQADIEALNIYVDLGDGNIESVSVLAVKGEMAQFEEQLFAMVSTLSYTPKPCDPAENP